MTTTKAITLTTTRLATLAAIARQPGIRVNHLPDRVCPRPPLMVDGVPATCRGWTAQGAARMAGRLTRALRDSGLIVITRTECGGGTARITDAGAAALRGAA